MSLSIIGLISQVSHSLLWSPLRSSSCLGAVGAIRQIRNCCRAFSVMLSVSRRQCIKVRMCLLWDSGVAVDAGLVGFSLCRWVPDIEKGCSASVFKGQVVLHGVLDPEGEGAVIFKNVKNYS